MATKLEVYNAVLDQIQQRPVDAVDSTQPPATILTRQWPFALNELLRAHPWNWAKARIELDAASPVPDFGWGNRFPLPDYFITLLTLNQEDVYDLSDYYEIEAGYLMTDEDTAQIEYIRGPNDESGSEAEADWTTDVMLTRMDPLAMAAFQTLLAAKIAEQVIKDGMSTSDALYSRYYNQFLPKARHRNVTETRQPAGYPYQRSNWLNARRQSTNG